MSKVLQSDQRAAIAWVAGFVPAFSASGRRRVPRAQGRVVCTSLEAAMTDFIQRRSFFIIFILPGSSVVNLTLQPVSTVFAARIWPAARNFQRMRRSAGANCGIGKKGQVALDSSLFCRFGKQWRGIVSGFVAILGLALPKACQTQSRITEISRP